jgi:hypothetical protein
MRRALLDGTAGIGDPHVGRAADALLIVPLDVDAMVPAGGTCPFLRLHAGDDAQEHFDLT